MTGGPETGPQPNALTPAWPERAAWGVALGLTVTLVWLYVEILRLLSYFQRD